MSEQSNQQACELCGKDHDLKAMWMMAEAWYCEECLKTLTLFRSWLNMTKEDIFDHTLRDRFARQGLLRLKP